MLKAIVFLLATMAKAYDSTVPETFATKCSADYCHLQGCRLTLFCANYHGCYTGSPLGANNIAEAV